MRNNASHPRSATEQGIPNSAILSRMLQAVDGQNVSVGNITAGDTVTGHRGRILGDEGIASPGETGTLTIGGSAATAVLGPDPNEIQTSRFINDEWIAGSLQLNRYGGQVRVGDAGLYLENSTIQAGSSTSPRLGGLSEVPQGERGA